MDGWMDASRVVLTLDLSSGCSFLAVLVSCRSFSSRRVSVSLLISSHLPDKVTWLAQPVTLSCPTLISPCSKLSSKVGALPTKALRTQRGTWSNPQAIPSFPDSIHYKNTSVRYRSLASRSYMSSADSSTTLPPCLADWIASSIIDTSVFRSPWPRRAPLPHV